MAHAIGHRMRIIITLSLLALVVASAASAEKFVPAPEQWSERVRSARPPVAVAQVSSRKPAVEVRQAPVPLRWSYTHQTVAVPAEQESAGSGPTIADLASRSLTEQASPMADTGEAAARAAIEADGYKGARGLTRGSDGSWSGRALRGRTEVAIRVSPDGSVSAD